MVRRPQVALALGLFLAASTASALDLQRFEQRLTEHRLDNGLTFLIYERPEAPVVSFYTYVDVGAAQEVPGITGLAHMFEHMAFKGTTTIGTKDFAAEKAAMAEVDAAYHAWATERDKSFGRDDAKVAELKKALEEAQQKARSFVASNEFTEIIERAGGVGINASTGADNTDYFYSLPSNKVELWAYLESERYLDPVLREFYVERDVVMEERRMRTDSQPLGRLIEQYLGAAYLAHPYGQPGVGHQSDLERFTREDALAFYAKYYTPANMTIAIVGDVKAKSLIPMLETYFGRLPKGEKTPPLRTIEPKQIGERSVVIREASQPIYVEGYHRPAASHPDHAAYEALVDVLSNGRTSRLYRSIVRDAKAASFASAFNGFPGDKYPNQVLFFAFTTPDTSIETLQGLLRTEIEKITSEPITDEELAMVKTRAKAGLIRGLGSNMGIAQQLAYYHVIHGDWRELFRSVEAIDALTKEDILRVAKETLVPNNRTVAMIVNEEAGAGAGGE